LAVVVFISSVRRGLEAERDALPGLISALGHVPSRFEDFTALPVPPRQACLAGVDAADIYLLVLGPNYGEPMPDTGLSPTEEEYNAAIRRGIPIVVLRRDGVEVEPRQEEFARRIGAYDAGRFRASFTTTADLLTKATAGIRAATEAPTQVEITAVRDPVAVPWLGANADRLPGRAPYGTTLEVHLCPFGGALLPATVLEGASTRLIRVAREGLLFGDQDAVLIGGTSEAAWVGVDRSTSRSAGLRLTRPGVLSLWRELPRDNLGTLVSVDSLAGEIRELVTIGAELISRGEQVGVTAGLNPIGMLVEGDPAALGTRTSASLGRFDQDGRIQLTVEASVRAEDLPRAAMDLARELAVRLLRTHREGRLT
jgi:hypothetical protein